MITYAFLQEYWWLLISVIGGALAFLLFVQGGQSMLASLPADGSQRKLMLNVLGRKWEFTFTTLVTFGGAFFASFPLFYSTSFGGAYWVWMIILFSFVLQAVSYEAYSKPGNLFGSRTYGTFLTINGVLGPFLIGVAVATFFTGSDFTVTRDNIVSTISPAISRWGNGWHGLEALAVPRNLALGAALLFLARTLALLFFINRIDHPELERRCRRALLVNVPLFVVFFLVFTIWTFVADGYAADGNGTITIVAGKYLDNMVQMPAVGLLFIAGVIAVLYGIVRTVLQSNYRKGIWFAGFGAAVTVCCLLLAAGWNDTAFYPSYSDLQSSLTIRNASSSPMTLKVMSIVSLIIPIVIAYIFYAWRSLERSRTDIRDIKDNDHAY